MNLWWVIAKNEFRMRSCRIRKKRTLFFTIVVTIALTWAFYIGPFLIDAVLPEILKYFTGLYKSYFVLLIDYFFTTMFIVYLMYPLFMVYRKTDLNEKILIYSTPVKPGDVFLGEFLGQLPFYSFFVLAVGPLGTSLLRQINSSLSFLSYLVFYSCIFTLLVFGLLIGTIISSWIEIKMALSKRLRQKDKTFLLISSLLVFIIFYTLRFLGEIAIYNPELRAWMAFYPPIWYSNVTMLFVEPSFVYSYLGIVYVNLFLIITLPLFLMYLSVKKAHVFFNLEGSSPVGVKNPDRKKHVILHVMSRFSKKQEAVITAQFNEFLRRKENKTKLLYNVILMILLGIIIVISLNQDVPISPEEIDLELIMSSLYDSKYVVALIISWMGGFLFGILMGINAFISSKEIIMLYRKSPRGPKALINSYLHVMVYFMLFLDLIFVVFFTVLFQFDLFVALFFFVVFILNSVVVLVQAVGIQCYKPLYNERSKDAFFNVYFILCVQIVSFLASIYSTIPYFPVFLPYSQGIMIIMIVHLAYSGFIAFLMYFFGVRRLNAVE